jgi:hypothetical protein
MKVQLGVTLLTLWLSSTVGIGLLQSLPPDGWLELIFNQGGVTVVAVLVLYWKRSDDQQYQKKTEAREEKLIQVLSETIRVMSEVTQTLETQGPANKILSELEELKRAYAAAARAETRPVDQRPT